MGQKRKKIVAGKKNRQIFTVYLKEIFPNFAESCVFTSSILTSTNKFWNCYHLMNFLMVAIFFCIFLETHQIEASMHPGYNRRKEYVRKKFRPIFMVHLRIYIPDFAEFCVFTGSILTHHY